MIHRFLACASALLLFIIVTACHRAPSASTLEAQSHPHRLTLHISAEPVSLDPTQAEDGIAVRLLANLMDGLTAFDQSGHLGLRAAESVKISSDLKTYEYVLKPGLVWSDGLAVEAEQFRIGIERALKPGSGSKFAGLLKWIDGADDFSKGVTARVRGIEISGRTIKFHLVKPISFFAEVLALPLAYPLRSDILHANGGRWDPLRGKKVPTNGSYRIRSATPDLEILLEANRPISPSAPSEVRIRIVSDDSTATNLFEEGSLDVLTRVPALDQARLSKKGWVRTVPFLATYFLGFNLGKKPFNRVENRRAFVNGLNREEIVRALGTGEKPASSWVPEGVEGFFPYAPSAQAKGVIFSKLGEITIGYDAGARNSLVMEKVQADLKDHLGVKVRLKGSDWKPFVHSIYADPEMVYRFGWSTPLRDPTHFLLPFTTKDPYSFSHYSNAKYDRLVEEIVGMMPSKEREAKIIAAQKIILEDDVVVVPLFHYVSTYAVSDRVKKFEMSPLVGVTLFEEVRLR
ncbi:MAG: peptide ABC transporter substrate-binding protein [Cryobacterium sp.]|nr:peptide ABC transporter substrate-binding protein [Oligoflexia bacterium]